MQKGTILRIVIDYKQNTEKYPKKVVEVLAISLESGYTPVCNPLQKESLT